MPYTPINLATALSLLALTCGSAAAQQAGPVTITLWQNSGDTEAENKLYRAWEEKTGNKIDLVSIPSASFIEATMTKWGTGSRPDILEWFSDGAFLAGLNPDENLQPLDGLDFVKRSNGLYDDTGNWNGRVYAVLLHAPVLYGMFYNKEVLAQAGIEPPKTYAELKAACAALKEKAPDVAPIFQAGGSSWPLTVLPFNLWGGDFAYGQKIAYNEATFGAEGSPFVDALNKFVELQDAGCYNRDITTATQEDSTRALVEGRAALLFQNTAEVVGLQAAAGSAEVMDQKIGFGSVGDEKPYANFQSNPIGVYVVPKSGDPAREAAALDFVRWATTEYYQTYVNDAKTPPTIQLPGIQQPTGVSALQQEVNDFYAAAPKEPLFNSNIAGFGEFVNLMPQLAAGQIDPQQLADRLQGIVAQASMAAGVKGWQ